MMKVLNTQTPVTLHLAVEEALGLLRDTVVGQQLHVGSEFLHYLVRVT